MPARSPRSPSMGNRGPIWMPRATGYACRSRRLPWRSWSRCGEEVTIMTRHLPAVICLFLGAATLGGAPVPPAPGTREIVPASAGWRFQLDVTNLGEKEPWYGKDYDRSRWMSVALPKAWDLFDEALWGYEGIGWYATSLPAAVARKDKVQRLKFGRVNYHSKVWLNGELVRENVNGYLPFEFDLTGKLRTDAPNLLVLRVDNRPRLTWLPGAKQIEWIQYGGILEPVTLESSAKVYISDLTINAVPEGAGASVSCSVEITSRETEEKEIALRLAVGGEPKPAAPVRVKIAPGERTVRQVSIPLAKANRWSPDTPFLYRLTAVIESGRAVDRLTDR